jgi:predicted TIM-barrel fold metal-dependent hydrolase
MTGNTHEIVDAHNHLWVRARQRQDWIDPATMAAIDRDFTVAELAGPAGAAGVTQSVVVQSVCSEAETEDLLGIAAAGPSPTSSAG